MTRSIKQTLLIASCAAGALGVGCGGPSTVSVGVLNLSSVDVEARAQALDGTGAPSTRASFVVRAGEQMVNNLGEADDAGGVAIEIVPMPNPGIVPYAATMAGPGPYRLRINGPDAANLTISRTNAAYDDRNAIPDDPYARNRNLDIPPVNPSR